MIKRLVNPNLQFLIDSFRAGKRGVILEGSSRSGKTWSIIDFFLSYCNGYRNTKCIITRETQTSFKTTLAEDFNRRLPVFKLRSPFLESQNVSQFKLVESTIHLIGADNPNKFEGAGSDIFWMNETLDQPQSVFDQLEQRCRRFWIMDYNPKVSDHWVFDKVCNRPDIAFLKTTFKDNPFISDPERKKILSYEPTPENIRNGTADDYRWKVYGLGVRCAQSGLVFQNVNWISEFPQDVDRVFYGLDFGFTNSPSALTKCSIRGSDLFIQYLIYEPTENADILGELMSHFVTKKDLIWCDSASPGMITSLDDHGYKAYGTKKFPGSILFGLDLMKRYRINVVRSAPAEKEFNNYAYRTINGIQLNEPIDDFNHGIDSARMAFQMSI
jgi:phage terminase large subunit